MKLVTCLCVTRNRPQWLPKAIECFESQTYAPRELLIVSTGDRPDVQESDRVRLIHVDEDVTIGRARNIGCLNARGEAIAHWDDDDWSSPERLERQMGLLVRTGRSVVGFNTMRFTDGEGWWMYTGIGDYVLGTSLVYRRDWWEANPFADMQVGEDNHFVMRAAIKREIVSADAGTLMYATVHDGNTSPRKLNAGNFKRID